MTADGVIPVRKPRCRLLDDQLNRCTSEEIEGTGLCAHHLAAAAADFQRIVAEHTLPAGSAGVQILRGADPAGVSRRD